MSHPAAALVLGALLAQPSDRTSLRQAILAAEDARAPTPADVQGLLDAARRGGEVEVQTAAVRALGRLERPSLLDALAPFLDAKSAAVRAEAASAVGQAVADGDERTVERARAVLLAHLEGERDPEALGAIAETLGRLPCKTADAVRAVQSALVSASQQSRRDVSAQQSTTASTRGTPVSGITLGFGRTEGDAPLAALVGALKGFEALLRQRGVPATPADATIARLRRVLETARPGARGGPPEARQPARAATGPDAVADELARARRLAFQALNNASAADERTIALGLQDEDTQVRRLAVQAAGLARGVKGRDAFMARGLDDAAPMVRIEAVRAYGRDLQASLGCAPIVAATGDADVHVAVTAIDQLAGGCADPAPAVAALVREANTLEAAPPDGWHRAAHALVTLARLAPEPAASRLPVAAAHPTWQVRMYAARAADALRDGATLGRLASDAHPNVREAALSGLVKLRGHEADPLSLAALESRDDQLVRTAALALSGSPAREQAATALMAALSRLTAERRDTSRDPRLAILATLRETGSAADAAALEPYLKDFDPRIAAEAATILTTWTGQTREPSTKRFAPSPAPVWSEIATLDRARVRVSMRRGGAFELALLASEAPATVDRVMRLARQNYYDGLTFHRVVPNFVIQGGSPGANEYAGDGPYLRDELGLTPHRRGAVGISTRGRDTGDAQIFIDLVDNPRLDHQYTVFATVVAGMDVVDDIREGDVIERVELVQGPRNPR